MQKTILITGATDGIGLETARTQVAQWHNVLLHGRNPAKLEQVKNELAALAGGGQVEGFLAACRKSPRSRPSHRRLPSATGSSMC